MNSSLYIGKVRHRRYEPLDHRFQYSLFLLYLDLDELEEVFRGRWFWSTRRFAPARFLRSDYLGDPEVSLKEAVLQRAEQELGRRPEGAVRMLTHLRYFGYCFNPISLYYCFAADGRELETVVAEVSNTPWGERHCYVIPARDSRISRYRNRKELHVSPFMEMDLDYNCPQLL